MIENIAIIVPIYKPDIDIVTEYSITTLFNVLSTKNRNVFFVSSRDMSKENYINLANKLTENYVYWIDENPEYFKSKETYSKMLMSYDFWKRFEAYEYALIYQTDCLLNMLALYLHLKDHYLLLMQHILLSEVVQDICFQL